jgi:hypothetical protein
VKDVSFDSTNALRTGKHDSHQQRHSAVHCHTGKTLEFWSIGSIVESQCKEEDTNVEKSYRHGSCCIRLGARLADSLAREQLTRIKDNAVHGKRANKMDDAKEV